MKKFSFISFILLASSLCAPSWAMPTEEGVQLRVRVNFRAPMSLTPEDQHQLLQDFYTRGGVQPPLDSQNTANKLDLTGKSPETWDPELKKTLALKPYRRTWHDLWRDALYFIMGVVSPSNSPNFVVFCTLSSLNLTRTNLSTDAVTQKFGHIVRNAPGIEVLNLSHNDITDEWLRYVCASDAFRKLPLKELNLSHNGIDKTAWFTLMTFPDLEKFDLSYNEVSECTVRRLKDFFLSRSAPTELNTFRLNDNPGTQYCPNLGVELVASVKR